MPSPPMVLASTVPRPDTTSPSRRSGGSASIRGFFDFRLPAVAGGADPLQLISRTANGNGAEGSDDAGKAEAGLKKSQSKSAIPGGVSARTVLSTDTAAKKNERENWSPLRKKAGHIFEGRPFDITMGVIILFNVGLMVIEADAGSTCEDEFSLCTPDWVIVLNYILLAIYTAELVARLWVFRRRFWASRWNIIDAAIVLLAYVEVIISTTAKVPGMQLVRIFRLGRLARLLRVLKVFPMLYSMVRGFTNTMTTIIWGFLMILALLLVWSLLTVELVHPRNKLLYASTGADTSDWCYIAFSSVGSSILYYFQTLVAGDSWGACSIPLMKEYHETFWIFSLAYITVQLGFTNLVLAVIVDAAAKARDEDLHQKMKKKKKQEKEATDKLLEIIRRMDENGDKKISWEELRASFNSDPEVQDLMKMLNINEKDLRRMFDFMDGDKNGSVDYNEFVEAISKAQESDTRVQLMMLQLHIADMAYLLQTKLGTINGVASRPPSPTKAHSYSAAAAVPQLQPQPPPPPPPTPPPTPAAGPVTVKAPAPPPKPLGEGLGDDSADSGGGAPEAHGAPWEAVATLERELQLMGARIEKRLGALARDATDQVSVLTQQTRSLSAALVLSRAEHQSHCSSARSQWSTKDFHIPPVIMTSDVARSCSQDRQWPGVARSAHAAAAVNGSTSTGSRGASKGFPVPPAPISGKPWLQCAGGATPGSPVSHAPLSPASPASVRTEQNLAELLGASNGPATDAPEEVKLREGQRSGFL